MGNLQNAAESKTDTDTDECKWPRKEFKLLQNPQKFEKWKKKKVQPKLRNNNNNKHRPNICVE